MALIIKHELVHFKRKDLWFKSLVIIAMAIHWFNPFIYLLSLMVSTQCELSCDEAVLENEAIKVRLGYFHALINTIKSQSKLKTSLSYNFYEGRREMKYRLSSILDTKPKKGGTYILLILLIIVLSTGTLIGCNKPTNKSTSEIQPKVTDNKKLDSPSVKVDSYVKSISKTYKSYDDFNKAPIFEIPYEEQKDGTTYSGILKFRDGNVIKDTNEFVVTYVGTIKAK